AMKDTEFNEAKHLYLEKYGDAIVTNNYLKIFGALLCLAVLGLVVLNLRTIRTFQSFRPLVIRIDDLGRAQAVDYKSLEYHPADHSVLKKTLYTANFILLFKEDVPNELIPINPLGLMITYFRQDQAFTNEVQR